MSTPTTSTPPLLTAPQLAGVMWVHGAKLGQGACIGLARAVISAIEHEPTVAPQKVADLIYQGGGAPNKSVAKTIAWRLMVVGG